MKKIFVISGPTASGKSSLALQISDFCDVAIVNADALQIYKNLPILSSQPTIAEKEIAAHFLYSHFDYDQSCSVALWLNLLKTTIDKIFRDNKTPIIVGGSGMYISKMFEGISIIPEISEEVKKDACNFYNNYGKEEFIKNLIFLGEEKARVDNLDKQRLIRSYEVLKQTGKTISWWQQNQEKEPIFNKDISVTHINLEIERSILYKNCNLRFEQMIKNGAIEEVRKLLLQDLKDDMQITKTLGVYEIRDFLQQEKSYEKMLEIVTQKTRNYAKRQLTWFRNQFQNKDIFSDTKSALDFLKKKI